MNAQVEAKVNGRIRATKVKVVTDDGGFLGVLPIKEALQLAVEKGLDLVEVSPNCDPPVAKIMDYGKFKYAQKKIQKKNMQANKSVLKEIKVRVNIADHDIAYKKRQFLAFLADGFRVKLTVCFHGRELTHKEIGYTVMNKLLEGIEASGKTERDPKMEGSNLSVIVVNV